LISDIFWSGFSATIGTPLLVFAIQIPISVFRILLVPEDKSQRWWRQTYGVVSGWDILYKNKIFLIVCWLINFILFLTMYLS